MVERLTRPFRRTSFLRVLFRYSDSIGQFPRARIARRIENDPIAIRKRQDKALTVLTTPGELPVAGLTEVNRRAFTQHGALVAVPARAKPAGFERLVIVDRAVGAGEHRDVARRGRQHTDDDAAHV